jgi:UDP-N-acetylmuramoyl-tripeptide--D-alanyl-D-alanine ligase
MRFFFGFAMSIEEIYQLFCRFPAISTDTRKPVRDSIFFALRGDKFDGNAFVLSALQNGAAYAVSDDNTIPGDPHIILVDNTLTTLQQLAAFHRSNLKSVVIAITGSNGKTTTKELITKVLSSRFLVYSTEANLNNHIGVPLTVLKIKGSDQFGIVEIGANHAGEIAALCRIARPDFGLITNIGRAHLEGFGSVEGVKKAKKELYEYLKEAHGKVFVNCGNPVLMEMLSGFPGEIIKYGNCEGTVLGGIAIKADPFLSLSISPAGQQDKRVTVKTRIPGNFNTENILAALGVGYYFGIDLKEMINNVMKYVPGNLRAQIMKTNRNTLFVDAYNANPTSMQAAISNFMNSPGKNKILIIGEMAELGDATEPEHRNLLSELAELDAERIFLVGNSFYNYTVPDEFMRFSNTQELSEWLKENPIKNANIMLKGSRIAGLEKLIPHL